MKENGYMVVSLDFELLWGVFDVVNYETKEEYFLTTRWVIPEILKLFEEYKIKSTWATVGMLFNENWDDWVQNIPKNIPEYRDASLSAYNFGKSIVSSKTEKFCFAPKLVDMIASVQGQEIGTHTYSHYYCGEPGQGETHFRYDLEKAIDLGKRKNLVFQSLVFPRNQLQENYLSICKELGIMNVRSNPDSWYWRDIRTNNLFYKTARTADAYFPFGKKTYKGKEIVIKNAIEQKASRFLRPVENNILMRKLKLRRIISEMDLASRNKEIYHLWWHPHNFGENPIESLNDLLYVLQHFQKLHAKFNFLSANMSELGNFIQESPSFNSSI